MLVLLIMFIITIPVATNSIDIDLPVATPPTSTPPPVDPIKNKIVLTADSQILWNGKPVDQNTLQNLLAQSLTYKVEPELQYQPEPQAGYELSAQVLQLIKAANVTKFGFVGNEQFRDFGK